MKILVDADGCPVKDEIIKVAKAFEIPVMMIKNIYHEIDASYAQIVTVDAGKDMADLALINHTQKGDIVVTQDYGVAALALGKKAYAIHQNGWLYTNDNIESLLMKRHSRVEARNAGHKGFARAPKRSKLDNEAFYRSLKALVSKLCED
jgi:hypothetical protein